MRRTPEALRACQNHQEKPLGLRGCVVCVMWCDGGGWVGWAREGVHFSQSKNARLLNS